MIKKLTLLLIPGLTLFCSGAFAQSLADIQTPKIVPPSPDAAALGKYAQVPVDKSTGIPNISIPIYDIKTPRFTLPISLSYHASGIKVDETASWAGLGWVLNAGGIITRGIVGIPDEAPGGYLNSATPPSASSCYMNFHADSSYLENICAHTQDSEPDNFFYNFVNQSGGFVYGENKQPITIPYKPIKITFLQDSTTRTSSFAILDEQGNNYWFHDREISNSYNPSSWYLTQMVSADKSDTIKFVYKADSVAFVDNNITFTQNLGPLSPTQGLWPMVTTIIPSNVVQLHISSIVFKGGKVEFKSKGGRRDFGIVSLDSVIVSNYDYNQKKYNRLKSFKLLTSYLVSGLSNPTTFYNDTTKSPKRLILTGLFENDLNGSAIKTHQFTYNAAVPLPPIHNFGQDKWGYYNGWSGNQSLLEAQNVIATVFPQMTPSVYTIGSGQGGNRSVSATAMQAGILTRITYPTKGYSIFNYEANQISAPAITDTTVTTGAVGYYHETNSTTFTPLVTGQIAFKVYIRSTGTSYAPSSSNINITQGSNTLYNQNASATSDISQNIILTLTAGTVYTLNVSAHGGNYTMTVLPMAYISTEYQVTGSNVATNVGGLRIKSIKNYDGNDAIISTETYKYGTGGAPESGVGDFLSSSVPMITHSFHNVQFSYGGISGPSVQPEDVYSNNSVYPLSSLSGSPVAYESVTVYHGDTVNNIGKSIYNYIVTPDSINVYSSPMAVVPLYVKAIDSHGNPYYRPWAAGTEYVAAGSSISGIKPIIRMWQNGDPVGEMEYLNNGSGQYLLQRSKNTSYNLVSRTAGRGLSVQFALDFYDKPRYYYNSYTNVGDFIIADYPISNGCRVPAGTNTTTYASDGVTSLTSETVNYYYDNPAHMYPTRIESYTSAGDSILKQVKYPQDMPQTGIYGTMTAANIISPVIQFTQSKNYTQNSSGMLSNIGTQLMQSITNYSNSNPNSIINPLNVSLQVMGNPAETRLSYPNYDSQGNLLTVSKANGAPASYVWGYKGAYPAAEVKNAKANDIFFESFEDGNGNTGYGDAKTGHYSYLGAYSKALTGLDNGSYLLTCWQKTGAVWALTTTTAAVSGGTYTISLTGQVDDVRFYPAAALMTSYTYDPLIGVTSATDAKGDITYYEYDNFQRLLNVRDQYKNIVKSFCYNYAGQVSNCFINLPSFTNAAQSGTFTKSCGTGYIGSAYTYTVPGMTYTSNISQRNADSLAQADVTANGPDAANLNGVCILSTGFTMTNYTGISGIQVTFYGSSNYTYTVPTSGSLTVQVPTATYTSMSVGNYSGPTHTFTLGARTPVTYSIAGFSNVNISTGSSDLTLTVQ